MPKRSIDKVPSKLKALAVPALREQTREYHRNRYQQTAAQKRAAHAARLATLPQGTYEQLLLQQDGNCGLCLERPRRGARGRIPKLKLDFREGTNELRGLICRECQAGLKAFGEDPLLLEQAARYLLGVERTS